MKTTLESADLINIIKGARQNLLINERKVNELNVFPVPDGDTGTNMGLTMTSTVKAVEDLEEISIPNIAAAVTRGAIDGSRGNSGVILSQILNGMCAIIGEAKVINTKTFAKALQNGSSMAYSIVQVPKEGTILTVIRVISDFAAKIANKTTDFEEFFQKIIKKGEVAVQETTEQLPELKKANVVDSGGCGLLCIIVGMYNALAGIVMEAIPEAPASGINAEFDVDDHNPEDIHFTYCTEIKINPVNSKTTLADMEKLRIKLNDIGDCVLVAGDLNLIKIHVHTNQPNKALEYALKLGQINFPKVENMRLQFQKIAEEKLRTHKEKGLLPICTGDGFKKLFIDDLGADYVLDGGQTMNPSVQAITKAIQKVNADTVFILPNNKNVYLACEQVKNNLDPEKQKVVIIHTSNVVQGIQAAMGFSPEMTDEENEASMSECANSATFIEVFKSAKDTKMDNYKIKEGDILAISSQIISKGKKVEDVVIDAIEKKAKDIDFLCTITLYYGYDVSQESAEKIQTKLQTIYEDCDVRICNGGQKLYDYFISLE